MQCPYCGNVMEKGMIQSPHELNWRKGEKRKLFGASFLHPDSVVLSEFSYLRGSAVTAWCCRACQKVIIDYGKETSDLNNP